MSFGRRIGASLVAEGIETRSDLATLVELGVEFGQGYLIGRPEPEPIVPRRGQVLRLAGARERLLTATAGESDEELDVAVAGEE